ncbi:MAG TPA: hypothetical protein VFN67_07050 [Polyangiales bacterium]|nr:hypothetical protein [Polyangiales bacterium]
MTQQRTVERIVTIRDGWLVDVETGVQIRRAIWHDKYKAERDPRWIENVPSGLLTRALGQGPKATADGLLAEIERLQKVVADQALTIGVLKDECARLQSAGKGLCANCGFACSVVDETDKLREEAQTSRLALDVAMQALRWFEERDEQIKRQADGRALGAQLLNGYLQDYARRNPKPGAAT